MTPTPVISGLTLSHWLVLTKLVTHFAALDWDPTRVWRLPALGRADKLPSVGPAVYMALTNDRCMYVGQSADLASRFRGHMANPYRRERWLAVAAIVLKADTPTRIVCRLEREAATRLKPVDGHAWPTGGRTNYQNRQRN